MAGGAKMRRTSGDKYDVIIIGAGHNGLVAASYLARSGLRVSLHERQHRIGGAAQALDIFGVKTTAGATWSGMLRPEIAVDLQLHQHGYTAVPLNPQVLAVAEDGRTIGLFLDDIDTASSVQNYYGEPRPDVLKDIHRYEQHVSRAARFIESIYPIATSAERLNHLSRAHKDVQAFMGSSIQEIFTRYKFPEFLKSALAAGALSLTNSSTSTD